MNIIRIKNPRVNESHLNKKKHPRHVKGGATAPLSIPPPPPSTFSGGCVPKSDQIFEFVPQSHP